MSTLRITQTTDAAGAPQIAVELERDGQRRRAVAPPFDTAIINPTSQDQDDLRWYLEDYLLNPYDPAPEAAARVERRMAAIGEELFRAVFPANSEAASLWQEATGLMDSLRVEIVGTSKEGATPWELLRDPANGVPVALSSREFIRLSPPCPRIASQQKTGVLRVLLVICRPGGSRDVPFRSVAGRLAKADLATEGGAVRLEVLRPPTFERLEETLRAAAEDDEPYHIVHFDGHGLHADLHGTGRGRGYLVFENPSAPNHREMIHGKLLGTTLVAAGVQILVLNACRSAHSDTEAIIGGTAPASPGTHDRVRAFGSLAWEVVGTGVAGVVAMRYNVYVETAARFVAGLYSALTLGCSLGTAVTLGRRDLAGEPEREIAFDPRPLQDWVVPIVYEAAQDLLVAGPTTASKRNDAAESASTPSRQDEVAVIGLPPPPEAGFFGGDETLLVLDRAFDSTGLVLLYGSAGGGKTALGAEFAQWYARTGGLSRQSTAGQHAGIVLFTSFQQYRPLGMVQAQLEEAFDAVLESEGIRWLGLDDSSRRRVALDLLRRFPVLWVWDNVEPIAGFPQGTPSSWTAAEQEELAAFLGDCRDTKAKILLTSRRDERHWLGELPQRVPVPPMRNQEQLQLVRALLARQGRRPAHPRDLFPLLEFAAGNPLTLTVLVRQAVREQAFTADQIAALIARLREGDADAKELVGSPALAASLNYGFSHVFTEQERRQVAPLHLFGGVIHHTSLSLMGEFVWNLVPPLKSIGAEGAAALLDKASEVGLLTALGGPFYSIHPALPLFLKTSFDQYYPTDLQLDAANRARPISPGMRARQAFAAAIGVMAGVYRNNVPDGSKLLMVLAMEEGNLRHALDLGLRNGWLEAVGDIIYALERLYVRQERWTEWARVLDQATPLFADPASGGPLPGLDYHWGFLNDYRVELLRRHQDLAGAERFQQLKVDWSRKRVATLGPAPTTPLQHGDGEEPDQRAAAIRMLGVDVARLGAIHRDRHNPSCVVEFEESFGLYGQVGDTHGRAVTAIELGQAYQDVPAVRSFRLAKEWYERGLALCGASDNLTRGWLLGNLGQLALEYLDETEAANDAASPSPPLFDADAPLRYYARALDVLPTTAIRDSAIAHLAIGGILGTRAKRGLERSDPGSRKLADQSLSHLRESLRYFNEIEERFGAIKAKYNLSTVYMLISRPTEAYTYVLAAERDMAAFQQSTAPEVVALRKAIAEQMLEIQRALQPQ